MLYLFLGEDTYRSRQALHEFIGRISSGRKRSLSLSRFTPDTFSRPDFEELLQAKNLFGGGYIVVCESLFQEKDLVDFFEKNLKLCARSENVFLFWEEVLEPSFRQNFKKNAEKISEFKLLSAAEIRDWLENESKKRKIVLPGDIQRELIQKCGGDLWSLSQELEKHILAPKVNLPLDREDKKVNVFHIIDAISARDKSRAWFLFQKALIYGADAEEIFWKIVWQIKNILILKKIMPMPEKKIAEITRFHPFVIKKAAIASRLYTEDELVKYSSELIDLYHNARRGLADFEIGIEKFLIKL